MTSISAPIVAVTVYPGQARVTRRGVERLPAGQARVLVGGLPTALNPDSVRVSGRGAATVLGVDVRPERNPRTPDDGVAELVQRREMLTRAMGELADKGTVYEARVALVTGLARRAGGTFAQALAKNETSPDRVAEVGEVLSRQLGDVLGERRDLDQARQRIQEELDQVARELDDHAAGQQPDRVEVAVDLDVAEETEVELELSYLVPNAFWESSHDVRLVGDTLTLTWHGLVTQHTGEDWPECELSLSTARPAGSVTVPELSPWYLDVSQPQPARARAAGGGYGSGAAMPAMAMMDAPPMGYAEVAVEHGATASTYRPTRPIAVPSDGTSHRTTVTTVELPARVDHVTVPLNSPDVYLRATVTNNSEHTFRPGRAALFHDAEYVGTTDLPTWAPGEETELALGTDDRVRVERKLVRRSAGKAVLGGTRKQEAEYRITVANHGPRPAEVTVVDQIPVSRHEAVTVKDVTLTPDPAERTDLGEVTWKLTLGQNEKKDITLGFRVDITKGADLTGWRD